jgi:hypothetical protein
MILLINGLFAQSLRYAQKIILGISTIYLWLFFSHALILNENPHKSTESFIHLIFRPSLADSQSQNSQKSSAIPAVLLIRID